MLIGDLESVYRMAMLSALERKVMITVSEIRKGKAARDQFAKGLWEFFDGERGDSFNMIDRLNPDDVETFNFVIRKLFLVDRWATRIAEPILKRVSVIKDRAWFIGTKSHGILRFPRARVTRDVVTKRLHNPAGPAIQFETRDYFFWKGYHVDRDMIMQPVLLKHIERERNTELRRILIEIYGFSRYLKDGCFFQVQRDDFGILYRKEEEGRHPAIQMVKVVNSTPEPDGSFKEYVLPVLNTVRSAHEAVASSFGLSIGEYNPFKQS